MSLSIVHKQTTFILQYDYKKTHTKHSRNTEVILKTLALDYRGKLYLAKKMNQTLKVTLIGITTTLTFAATANQAQALDFSFSGYEAGTISADGTFSVNDTAVSSGILSQADIQDWEINISDSATSDSVTLYGDGGSFGTDNSDIFGFNGGTVNSSTLAFTNNFQIRNEIGGSDIGTLWQISPTANRLRVGSQSFAGTESALVANASAATPVPFGVAPNTGILILGGMWGVSRLRKKMAAN